MSFVMSQCMRCPGLVTYFFGSRELTWLFYVFVPKVLYFKYLQNGTARLLL